MKEGSGPRVLVCGGREYGCVPKGCPREEWQRYSDIAARERFMLNETLDVMHADQSIAAIIHGDAPGADNLAAEWADRHGVWVMAFPADWKALGKAAGPIRNARMLMHGRPDLVLAFPGGKGTANMVELARTAHVRVVEVGP